MIHMHLLLVAYIMLRRKAVNLITVFRCGFTLLILYLSVTTIFPFLPSNAITIPTPSMQLTNHEFP